MLALLPLREREARAGLLPMDAWVPESFVGTWLEAVWCGPAKRDPLMMRKYVAATIAHGYGLVRRRVLPLLTPETLARRAPEAWREEHTTGVLELMFVEKDRAGLRLLNHPYVETPLLRMSAAEALRSVASLTRATNVKEKHSSSGLTLIIELSWEPKGLTTR